MSLDCCFTERARLWWVSGRTCSHTRQHHHHHHHHPRKRRRRRRYHHRFCRRPHRKEQQRDFALPHRSGFGRLEVGVVVVEEENKRRFPEDASSSSSSPLALWWWRWWCLEDDRAVEKREREKHGVFENNENAKRAVSVGCFSGWRIGHHTSAESNEKRKTATRKTTRTKSNGKDDGEAARYGLTNSASGLTIPTVLTLARVAAIPVFAYMYYQTTACRARVLLRVRLGGDYGLVGRIFSEEMEPVVCFLGRF